MCQVAVRNFLTDRVARGGKLLTLQPDWKVCRWGSKLLLQSQPVKTRAWVKLAARRNVLMARDVPDWVLHAQLIDQYDQHFVLGAFEKSALQAFKLDANGVVITVAAAAVRGLSGVPGPVIATYKLPKLSKPADEKMRRDFQALNA